ncbi:Crp/Fnr family transcriptional regulator [Flavobacterium sp. NKUCC04_CG]|uniref:Crp/Fnr family transcriptional regulator n=1 Tax=Flavobacterium sp. NKUCC04_CG TaxID=2842121 RepID=UPI001C5AA05D|nr:Crp/Fnr family transcriptional regulator [Flavobacterium sp. NKUCC04_CG]MBW3519829.1 Crp/Fnr family transcriptional regulator [Flavobacterium sp. NKUCC04_CG]
MFERVVLNPLLTAELIAKYEHFFVPQSFAAKTILLDEGQIAEKVYWIKKGCVRVWINHQGSDVTFQFFLENSLVASMESFWKGIPSQITIETIEACDLLVADKKDIKTLIDGSLDIPVFRDLFIEALFDRTFDYMQHSLSFIKLTPEQRYLKLLAERPELVQRIAQHYLASYLGISKVHLSRIKSKLALK